MFLLFAGETYYPLGGWEDYRGVYGSLDLARDAASKLEGYDWWHIVDASKGRIVYSDQD